MHVFVKTCDEPWIKDAEPGSSFNAVDGGEDGEKAVLKWFAACAFLREARCGDDVVVGGELLKLDA